MEIKEVYYKALIENNGQLNEIDIGEKFGLDEEETREIIVQLLSEHKIEYVANRFCSYRPNKPTKRKITAGNNIYIYKLAQVLANTKVWAFFESHQNFQFDDFPIKKINIKI